MSNNDSTILKTIAHKTPTAIRVFTDWAMRERHRGPIDIAKHKRSLRNKGESIDDKDYETMLRELQEAGFGKLLKDHKGNVRYFEFHHPVYRVGKAAIDDKPIVFKKSTTAIPSKPRPKAMIAEARQLIEQPQHTMVYCVFSGRKIKLDIEGKVDEKMIDQIVNRLQ